MKICIIGPGIMPIPPNGWGAVEILIWDLKCILEKLNHEVLIVNTRNFSEIISQCNNFKPDFVHVQYDEFWHICDSVECNNVAITSHYGYLDQENRWDFAYQQIVNGFVSMKKSRIFALSQSISNQYQKRGFDKNKLRVVPNGVRNDLFKFEKECQLPNKSIYLAKIDYRKRQHQFQSISNIDFVGNCIEPRFNVNNPNYLGEWDKNKLYNDITKYANLVLLSDGEAHPLVCLEAMSAGLGLVISEWATANLDTSLPFIDVIPENKIHDIEYIRQVIDMNREKSIIMRESIREYVVTNFSWDVIVKNHYLPSI